MKDEEPYLHSASLLSKAYFYTEPEPEPEKSPQSWSNAWKKNHIKGTQVLLHK